MVSRTTTRTAFLGALTVLLLSSGCTFFRTITGSLQRPTLTYESWSPEQLDLDGVTIALHYRVDNPNDFGLDLRRLDYRLEVEGQQVVEGQLPAGLQLGARAATPLTIPVRLRWSDIPNFVELLMTRSELGYRVSGTAGIGSELGMVALPFEHRDRVAVPRPVIRFESGR